MTDKNTQHPSAICLVSGGMDSLVSLAIAKKDHENVAVIHLNYGQKTQAKELACFHKICEHYQIPMKWQKIIDLGFLQQIGGSSLTDQLINVTDFAGDDSHIPSSYVPFRNTHIIALAVSWAEVIGAKFLYIGAVEEDSSGYPDCRKSYYEAYNKLIQEGTKDGDIKIITPVIELKKSQIVQKAIELKAPLNLTWSCYAKEDKACGVCDSCALRLRGFQQAGIEDPIEYDKKPKY